VGHVHARGTARRRVSVRALVGGLVVALPLGFALIAPPAAEAAVGPAPGSVAHPISKLHMEDFEWFNILQVVDAQNRIVRTIKIAGNPLIKKPPVCSTAGRIRVNWDYSLTWRLNYFTRRCSGRGMGTHDVPINRFSGRRSMNAADLGKAPFHGGPLSHGCLRMAAVDAKYIYDHLSNHVPIYFVETPWRKSGPRPPSGVTGLHATAGDHQATFSWAAPALHGAALTGYVVTLAPGGASVTIPASARTATFTGLANGTGYSASVVPTSTAGAGPPARTPAAVPYGVPGSVTSVVVVRGPGDVAFVTWAPAPPNGATVTRYLVSVDGGPAVPVLPYPAQAKVHGAVDGAPVHVEVAAVNAAGAGAPGVFDSP
jgi:Fibronectin type III domain